MMRRSTGLALVAAGAILALAVHVPLAFPSLRFTGLILMITGLVGLRVPQRAHRWLHAHREQLTWAPGRFMEPPLPPSPRVPLDDLLRPEAGAETAARRRG